MSSGPNEKYVLSLCTKTWVRDSHGLFDYESNQTKHLNAILAESVFITRKKHEIKTVNNPKQLQEEEELLFNVRHDDINKFVLESPVPVRIQPSQKNINELSNKIWYILKNDPIKSNNSNQVIINTNDDYYLCKNDVIKLGRVKYSLNEINIPSREDERLCKICYSEENDRENNPLVHLCNCNGGLRFSHYMCIKRWMETKLQIKENEKKTVKSYNIKSFNCEICKTPYPFKFKLNGIEKPFELIELEKPVGCDYIVLESLNQMKENCNIKSIHVIQLGTDELIIGRGHESDIRINDISVSRSHAKLKYDMENGTILLRDLKSKFGTLILIKKPLQIKEKKIHIQIGRTYIEGWLMGMEEFNKLRKEKKNKMQNKEHQHTPVNPEQNMPIQNNNGNNNMDLEDNNNNLGQKTYYPTK